MGRPRPPLQAVPEPFAAQAREPETRRNAAQSGEGFLGQVAFLWALKLLRLSRFVSSVFVVCWVTGSCSGVAQAGLELAPSSSLSLPSAAMTGVRHPGML